ncbi:ABC transporter substrate-binding protein [Streptomyces sp. S465]|uniref:ABC transporter substrate-binding protein n=1 Tax=Streptomyces sp. S465 TaxID=2979468 RepID=UPI0022A8C79B|nr:ABC transporter substrate-binding protein [Streptomyces sp. S465]WAP53571.1 ABC transporter substrate-binding protein [Streptomyces sp. S465]
MHEPLRTTGWSRRPTGRHRLAAFALVSALFVGACSGTGSVAADDGQLSLQFAGPPISLNPALAGNGGSTVFTALTYDPLIYLSGEGKLVPDLATEWHYTDDTNTVFVLELREGVRFYDGSALDADAVAASMKYFLKAGGGLVGKVGAIKDIKATGPMEVRITYAEPQPDAAMTMTQYNGIGNIIGPKGLANPQSLLTSSDGTGQYVYDGDASVAGNRYVYKRNPRYFRPSAQQFESVAVHIIGNANAVLSAARTGQVQYASGNPNTAGAAERAGLTVRAAPFYNWALNLVDRKGTVSPPLADRRVRQAMALAFDRPTMAHGLAGEYASASDQMLLPGTDGYDKSIGYGHNVRKAKKLLAEAGYPDGFHLTVLTQSLIDPNTNYSQAIAAALEDIGIDVTLKVQSTGIAQYSADALSKKYAATIFPNVGATMAELDSQVMNGAFNPFGSSDKKFQALLDRAAAETDDEARTELYQKASKRLEDLAWFVPVFATKNISYASPNLENITSSVINPNPVPVGPSADLSWRLK